MNLQIIRSVNYSCQIGNYSLHCEIFRASDLRNTLKVERAKLGISQTTLANRVKVSRQTIVSIETNRKIPSVELALRISTVFNVSVEQVFQLDVPKSKRYVRRKAPRSHSPAFGY